MVRRGKGGDVVKVGILYDDGDKEECARKSQGNIKRGGRETRMVKVRGCLFVERMDASMNQSGRLTISNTKL